MKDLSKLIICIIAALAGILTAAAQNTQQHDFSTVSINGLELDRYYTREQLIDALGVPDEEDDVVYSYFVYYTTKIMTPASNRIESDFNIARRISDGIGFGGIHGRDSVRFCVFTLNSDRFAVNDYIRVGDPVSKVYNMGGSVRDINGGGKLYWWASFVTDYIEDEDLMYNPAFWYDKNGIITKIELYYD